MRHTLEEEFGPLEETRRPNEVLQLSCSGLAQEIAGFAWARDQVLQELAVEQELLVQSRLMTANRLDALPGLAAPAPVVSSWWDAVRSPSRGPPRWLIRTGRTCS